MSEQRTYEVAGMSCEHCVAAVGAALGDLPGVERVEVDLAAGRAAVTGVQLDDAAVTAALAEAGYTLA